MKQNLARQRLCLAAKHEASHGRIARNSYQYHVGELAIVESKIIWLQTRLSLLCSTLCSFLVVWDDTHIDKEEWRCEIRSIIEEISIPKDVCIFIAGRKKLEQLDPWFAMDKSLSRKILSEIDVRSESLKHYGGVRPFEAANKDVNTTELFEAMEQIKSINLRDDKSINQVVALIGKNQAFDFKHAWSTKFLKGRLN